MCVFSYVYVQMLFTLHPHLSLLLFLSCQKLSDWPRRNLALRPEWKKTNWKKVTRNEPKNENFRWENGNSRNNCSANVGVVGIEGMMTLPKIGALVWDCMYSFTTACIAKIACIDKIACIALPVLPPDLEVLPPATPRCGLIFIFEEGSFIWRNPVDPMPVWRLADRQISTLRRG